MTDKKISVIMACYNCEKTLKKAIDSILAQTYQNWVMICCDDGSSDGTLEILNKYRERYPEKFVIIQNEGNKKLPYSLNHCLKYVDTELVARMDGDDWSLPERFEKQVKYLEEHPECDLVSTGVTVSDGEKKIASIIKEAIPNKETVLRYNPFSHATIMTYKYVYDQLGGYSLDPAVIRIEDFELWCRFLAVGFVGHNMPDELYVILENPDAVSRRSFSSRVNAAKTTSKCLELLGFSGLICIKPYFGILKSLFPEAVYKVLHKWRLKYKRYS